MMKTNLQYEGIWKRAFESLYVMRVESPWMGLVPLWKMSQSVPLILHSMRLKPEDQEAHPGQTPDVQCLDPVLPNLQNYEKNVCCTKSAIVAQTHLDTNLSINSCINTINLFKKSATKLLDCQTKISEYIFQVTFKYYHQMMKNSSKMNAMISKWNSMVSESFLKWE